MIHKVYVERGVGRRILVEIGCRLAFGTSNQKRIWQFVIRLVAGVFKGNTTLWRAFHVLCGVGVMGGRGVV